ncbi:hypothetical protein B0T26DRAFT_697350 [Lasiosphaeria miniovina]|uniref:Uncharacterized protein n=1 Tax=Lasiosphaeria miniovina TaxID=1954250 RepID=A0AA40E4U5_9PEZI|nr:uncharacterized protein B0T26DRAFT_697350 [Lasiosphaeria miniovina]KAK0728239.1 hypothetical protein B0T26DRAFT_697350 [Lasiosphaeria miniovina]
MCYFLHAFSVIAFDKVTAEYTECRWNKCAVVMINRIHANNDAHISCAWVGSWDNRWGADPSYIYGMDYTLRRAE